MPVTDPLERGRAPALQIFAIVVTALAGLSIPRLVVMVGAEPRADLGAVVDRAASAALALVGVSTVILVRRGHFRLGALALVAGFLVGWAAVLPTAGLARQAQSLSLLGVPILISGLPPAVGRVADHPRPRLAVDERRRARRPAPARSAGRWSHLG